MTPREQQLIDDLEGKLSGLARRFRSAVNDTDKRLLADQYGHAMDQLFEIDSWWGEPPLDAQLPDEWMPESYKLHWSQPIGQVKSRLLNFEKSDRVEMSRPAQSAPHLMGNVEDLGPLKQLLPTAEFYCSAKNLSPLAIAMLAQRGSVRKAKMKQVYAYQRRVVSHQFMFAQLLERYAIHIGGAQLPVALPTRSSPPSAAQSP